MKTFFQTLLLCLISIIALGQAPKSFNYQAVLRNDAGEPLASEEVDVKIDILIGSATGTQVFTETHETETNEFGLVNIKVGSESSLAGIDWSADDYFIRVSVDGTVMGTTQLLSVPYALHAETAEETDPVFNASPAGGIETEDIGRWDEAYSWGDHSKRSYATKAYVNDLTDDIYDILIAADYAVKDIDGNVYPIVTIGTQVWMTKNLRTTKFNDGTPITKIEDNSEWSFTNSPAYCWYDNDAVKYSNPYGALYNWYAASSGNLCPVGWHVPTEDDLDALITYLGGTANAGGKLKETGTEYWNSPNEGATNESGFTAIATGARLSNGSFSDYENFKNNARFWSATEGSSTPPPGNGIYMILYHNSSNAYTSQHEKNPGRSIRCIKD